MPSYKPRGILANELKKVQTQDYKNVLENYRNNDLISDVCEGKTTLTEKAEELESLTKKKYGGFWNFWKPYRSLDKEYNEKVENLENALGIETRNIKTGRTGKAIIDYISLEAATDIMAVLLLLASYGMTKLPAPANSDIYSEMLKQLNVYGLLFSGLGFKYFFTPQLVSRRKRNSMMKLMKQEAAFLDSIIKEVYHQ